MTTTTIVTGDAGKTENAAQRETTIIDVHPDLAAEAVPWAEDGAALVRHSTAHHPSAAGDDRRCAVPMHVVPKHVVPKDPKHVVPKDPKHVAPKDPKHVAPKDPKHVAPSLLDRNILKTV